MTPTDFCCGGSEEYSLTIRSSHTFGRRSLLLKSAVRSHMAGGNIAKSLLFCGISHWAKINFSQNSFCYFECWCWKGVEHQGCQPRPVSHWGGFGFHHVQPLWTEWQSHGSYCKINITGLHTTTSHQWVAGASALRSQVHDSEVQKDPLQPLPLWQGSAPKCCWVKRNGFQKQWRSQQHSDVTVSLLCQPPKVQIFTSNVEKTTETTTS